MNRNRIYSDFIKRFFDIICALLAIIVFCWLYAIIAVLVRVKLGRPVIYSTMRTGKGGKPFRLFKFRSMTNETDGNGKLLPDAQRLTKFGRKLRSTSLDELPEAFNILKGDMSVIGPRPWPVSYDKYFTEEEFHRYDVRPGLSGWAQVNGRTTANWDDRLKFDLEYVNKISFLFDAKVVLTTVKKFVSRSDIVDTAEEQGSFRVYREKQWAEGIVQKPENFK